MWGLNFDEKEKHSSWLFSYALIGKLLGARYGGGGAVSLEKNRACQLGLGTGFTSTPNVQTSVAYFSLTFCLKRKLLLTAKEKVKFSSATGVSLECSFVHVLFFQQKVEWTFNGDKDADCPHKSPVSDSLGFILGKSAFLKKLNDFVDLALDYLSKEYESCHSFLSFTVSNLGMHVSFWVVSYSLWPHALWPARLLCPWNFPGKNTGQRLRFPTPGNLPGPGIEPKSLMSPAFAGGFLPCTDICPGVGMLVHIATIFHFLRGTCILFSIVAAPVYIPANNVRGGFPFLHTLSSIYYL